MKLKRIISLYLIAIILTLVFSVFIAATVQAQEIVEVPQDVKEISEELGSTYNICPETIQAICWQESRFQTDAENGGCVGIMQVAPKWHKERMDKLGITDLTDTRQNMTVAVDYLSELLKDGEDMEEALMRYHGESRIAERLDAVEMSIYVKDILTLSAELEKGNGK